ncbi:hypothetical protein ALC57_02492 [Trachymyrmex cornetzi]|uniref:Uncharacterized protein n=1 Tax=Trachymyrmex cornetzi TaxID=471704 RepID=A0A195EIR3_9HYME|nr:hypothetical protein ALC57_02492 [Trachymyrmex cornetzi]
METGASCSTDYHGVNSECIALLARVLAAIREMRSSFLSSRLRIRARGNEPESKLCDAYLLERIKKHLKQLHINVFFRLRGTLHVVLFRESGDKERRQNGDATTKIRGKLARVWYDPLAQFAQAVMPISPQKAALRGELRYANSRLSAIDHVDGDIDIGIDEISNREHVTQRGRVTGGVKPKASSDQRALRRSSLRLSLSTPDPLFLSFSIVINVGELMPGSPPVPLDFLSTDRCHTSNQNGVKTTPVFRSRAAACGVLDLSRIIRNRTVRNPFSATSRYVYREEEEQRNETSRTNEEEEEEKEEEKEEEEEEGSRQRQRRKEGTEPVFERSGESGISRGSLNRMPFARAFESSFLAWDIEPLFAIRGRWEESCRKVRSSWLLSLPQRPQRTRRCFDRHFLCGEGK